MQNMNKELNKEPEINIQASDSIFDIMQNAAKVVGGAVEEINDELFSSVRVVFNVNK